MSSSTLKGQQIGQGAAFPEMMRQLGGAFGVAIISTFMLRDNMLHHSTLIIQLSSTTPDVQQRLAAMQAGFIAKGMSLDRALQSSYQLLEGAVTKQSTLLSYMDVFLYIGLMFLACVALVIIFVKHSKKVVRIADAAH